jgi:hypothetical protein
VVPSGSVEEVREVKGQGARHGVSCLEKLVDTGLEAELVRWVEVIKRAVWKPC